MPSKQLLGKVFRVSARWRQITRGLTYFEDFDKKRPSTKNVDDRSKLSSREENRHRGGSLPLFPD